MHREIQQRSPISGSRRPSITSMLSSTIGNTSLIAAQVQPYPIQQKTYSNLFKPIQKTYSIRQKTELGERSRQKIQGRPRRAAEAWSSNFGGGPVFGVFRGNGRGQVGTNLVPSFIFTLAWPDPFHIPEQHFSQQSDFFF